MAHDPGSSFDPAEREAVLALALGSVRHGLQFGRPSPAAGPHLPRLAAAGACFVSLHIGADLRGCVGQTGPSRSLAEQIVENAWAAAFRDPRFAPLGAAELALLSIEVHVLGPLEPLSFADLPSLHALLRPGRDGLQLEAEQRRAIFLPVMWKQLPTAAEFVGQLLRKGGMSAALPLVASRFGAEVIANEGLLA
jgi:AmmeMemoRadiSam system protein A